MILDSEQPTTMISLKEVGLSKTEPTTTPIQFKSVLSYLSLGACNEHIPFSPSVMQGNQTVSSPA